MALVEPRQQTFLVECQKLAPVVTLKVIIDSYCTCADIDARAVLNGPGVLDENGRKSMNIDENLCFQAQEASKCNVKV